jgi:hypothetical protein
MRVDHDAPCMLLFHPMQDCVADLGATCKQPHLFSDARARSYHLPSHPHLRGPLTTPAIDPNPTPLPCTRNKVRGNDGESVW